MNYLAKNPGTVAALAAVVVLVVGGFAGAPLGLNLLVAFALIVLGATLVNGTYVLRRLIIVIPTVVAVTAFTFWLQNSRGDKRDLAFILLGPGATEAGVIREACIEGAVARPRAPEDRPDRELLRGR